MNPLIKTANLNVIYDEGTPAEFQALKDINIEIFPEEYVIFFGPSGCGKSTLLYAIAGLETRIKGSIVVAGRDISKLSRRELERYHRQEVGMVFQAYYLIPSISVLDNVALPQIFSAVSLQERRKKALALLERFGVAEQADKRPSELSGGQQQRVAIARAAINKPKILLADEPVGNLDTKSQVVVMNLLQELNLKDKQTIVLVTHDPNYLSYADRVFYMKDGMIVRVVKNREKGAPKKPGQFQGQLQALIGQHPSLPEEQLKARLLRDYLITGFREEELSRLEKVLVKRLKGELTQKQLLEVLDRSFDKGGVGMDFRQAKNFSHQVGLILHKAQVISRAYTAQVKALYLRSLLTKRTFLTRAQKEVLTKLLIKRLKKKINATTFYAGLRRSTKQGGVGLRVSLAKPYAHQVEIILAESRPRAEKSQEKRVKKIEAGLAIEDKVPPLVKEAREEPWINPVAAHLSSFLITALGGGLNEKRVRKISQAIKEYLLGRVSQEEVAAQLKAATKLPGREIDSLLRQLNDLFYFVFFSSIDNLINNYFKPFGDKAIERVTELVRDFLCDTINKEILEKRLVREVTAQGWGLDERGLKTFLLKLFALRRDFRFEP